MNVCMILRVGDVFLWYDCMNVCMYVCMYVYIHTYKCSHLSNFTLISNITDYGVSPACAKGRVSTPNCNCYMSCGKIVPHF